MDWLSKVVFLMLYLTNNNRDKALFMMFLHEKIKKHLGVLTVAHVLEMDFPNVNDLWLFNYHLDTQMI